MIGVKIPPFFLQNPIKKIIDAAIESVRFTAKTYLQRLAPFF